MHVFEKILVTSFGFRKLVWNVMKACFQIIAGFTAVDVVKYRDKCYSPVEYSLRINKGRALYPTEIFRGD